MRWCTGALVRWYRDMVPMVCMVRVTWCTGVWTGESTFSCLPRVKLLKAEHAWQMKRDHAGRSGAGDHAHAYGLARGA